MDEENDYWIKPVIQYIKVGILQTDKLEAKKTK